MMAESTLANCWRVIKNTTETSISIGRNE